jgi:hypothetical protein
VHIRSEICGPWFDSQRRDLAHPACLALGARGVMAHPWRRSALSLEDETFLEGEGVHTTCFDSRKARQSGSASRPSLFTAWRHSCHDCHMDLDMLQEQHLYSEK